MTRKEYSPSSATMSAFGKTVEGWTKFSYNYNSEVTKNYSGNNKLTSYSTGKQNEEGTLEVYHTQLREWEKHCLATTGTTDLLKLGPVALAFTFFDDDLEETTDTVTVLMHGAGRTVDGGSDGLKTEIQITVLDMKIDA